MKAEEGQGGAGAIGGTFSHVPPFAGCCAGKKGGLCPTLGKGLPLYLMFDVIH